MLSKVRKYLIFKRNTCKYFVFLNECIFLLHVHMGVLRLRKMWCVFVFFTILSAGLIKFYRNYTQTLSGSFCLMEEPQILAGWGLGENKCTKRCWEAKVFEGRVVCRGVCVLTLCVDVIMRVGWSENLLSNKAAIRRESVNAVKWLHFKGLQDYM